MTETRYLTFQEWSSRVHRDPTIFEDAARLVESTGLAKFVFAEDKDGSDVHITSPRATSFCIQGAVARAAYDRGWIVDRTFEEAIMRLFVFNGLASDLADAYPAIRSTTTEVVRWSNRYATSHEVADCLRAFAKTLREQAENAHLV